MELENQGTALLVLDMQVGILPRLPNAEQVIGQVAKAIKNARNKKVPVIYVTVGFRQGAPEVSRNNKSFGALKENLSHVDMVEFMKIHLDLAPNAGELIVAKRRVSAFTGSDLEVILRSQGIQHIVLTGVATSGAVLSTLREAADKDYRITVIADCCADGDEEIHRVLTTKIFTKQAEVLNLEEWIKI